MSPEIDQRTQVQQIVSERIDPHHFVSKPKISKKSHDQLRMTHHGARNGSHGSGNAALSKTQHINVQDTIALYLNRKDQVHVTYLNFVCTRSEGPPELLLLAFTISLVFFAKIKPLLNGEITLSFTGEGKSCRSRECLAS